MEASPSSSWHCKIVLCGHNLDALNEEAICPLLICILGLLVVERFACLYTSQVTNLSLYSPDKYYRPSEDFMPHEFDILSI
ncbi:hypothetical protein CK203_007931 [Vitis vinifera]|uniref:Uncharacterized protein n=1 Tax=Vitis vinifera TaxID=29760 RepID=A0A438K2A1_VITVI|nr:hypothetical protein CK203_007931 [Vitis vinifera]